MTTPPYADGCSHLVFSTATAGFARADARHSVALRWPCMTITINCCDPSCANMLAAGWPRRSRPRLSAAVTHCSTKPSLTTSGHGITPCMGCKPQVIVRSCTKAGQADAVGGSPVCAMYLPTRTYFAGVTILCIASWFEAQGAHAYIDFLHSEKANHPHNTPLTRLRRSWSNCSCSSGFVLVLLGRTHFPSRCAVLIRLHYFFRRLQTRYAACGSA